MPDKCKFKNFQTYYEDEPTGRTIEGIPIKARDKHEAIKMAIEIYGDSAEVKIIKVKK